MIEDGRNITTVLVTIITALEEALMTIIPALDGEEHNPPYTVITLLTLSTIAMARRYRTCTSITRRPRI